MRKQFITKQDESKPERLNKSSGVSTSLRELRDIPSKVKEDGDGPIASSLDRAERKKMIGNGQVSKTGLEKPTHTRNR